MPGLAARERDLANWLAEREQAMVSLLAELVNIDSGTADVGGVDAMARRVAAFHAEAGLTSSPLSRPPRGGGLRVELPGSGRAMLLMGHLDTVFPPGEAERRPFAIAQGRASGPGVADMKAGLVMNSFVLAAFKAVGGNRRPIIGLYTGDEEVGSSAYREVIEAEARNAGWAFNAEPARSSGNIVIERRGGVFLRLIVKGKAAHSGIDIRAGISAIDELANKILALHALTNFEAEITVNVGVVSGGQSVNTTAPSAEALIDLRFRDPADRVRLMAAIEAIVARSWTKGSSARLEITGEFVPLVGTAAARAMFADYQGAARDLGFEVDAESTGGCADSGFAAASGAITLCGLGPVGGNAHSDAEYVEIDTIVPRAQALALTICRLDQDANDDRATIAQPSSPDRSGESRALRRGGSTRPIHGVADDQAFL